MDRAAGFQYWDITSKESFFASSISSTLPTLLRIDAGIIEAALFEDASSVQSNPQAS